jgi:hypothetical protein
MRKTLFRIAEVMISDKNLSKFLIACAPYVDAMSVPQPVVNARIRNDGKIEEETSGKASEMFVAYLRKLGRTEFVNNDVREWLPTIGRSAKSTQTVLSHLVEEKLARNKSRGHWVLK